MIGRMAGEAAALTPLQLRLRETALTLIAERRLRDLHPAVCAIEQHGPDWRLSEIGGAATLPSTHLATSPATPTPCVKAGACRSRRGRTPSRQPPVARRPASQRNAGHLWLDALVAHPCHLVSEADCHYGVVTASGASLAHAVAALKAGGPPLAWARMAIVSPDGHFALTIEGETAVMVRSAVTGRAAA